MTKERVLTLALQQLQEEIYAQCRAIAATGKTATLDELEKLFAERMELKQERNPDESGKNWFEDCNQRVQSIQKCIRDCKQELRNPSASGKEC